MKINILGQDYDLLIKSDEEFPKFVSADADGMAELYDKKLLISKEGATSSERTFDNLEAYTDKVIRHEIVHAYFHEAGLNDYCRDEMLVDWLAIQLPKMAKTIKHVEENKKELFGD